MVTLGKFKYYRSLIANYLTQRFGLVRFAGLSLLLVMMSATTTPDWLSLVENFFFILISLFVFRLTDDAWSFHFDRINYPDRTYIRAENFKIFIIIGILIYLIFQIGLIFYNPFFAQIILGLYLISSVLYFVFYKSKFAMTIIPILKYPVFIWCILAFSRSNESLGIAIASFSMMLLYDYLQKDLWNRKAILITLILGLITGLFIMQPWLEESNIFVDALLISISLFIIISKKIRAIPAIPVIIFPIAHIIDILL